MLCLVHGTWYIMYMACISFAFYFYIISKAPPIHNAFSDIFKILYTYIVLT